MQDLISMRRKNMPNINEIAEIARSELTIFYILDTSENMSVSELNSVMKDTIESLKDISKHNADVKLKIAVLEFNSGCKWMTNEPKGIDDFDWKNLTAGGSLTNVGAALKELDSKLSRNAFLQPMTYAYLPVIIFMTDGCATDDYKKSLAEIRNNKWFTRATKIGFALGESPNMKIISEVVGNSEGVIKANDLDLFARLVRLIPMPISPIMTLSKWNDVKNINIPSIYQLDGKEIKVGITETLCRCQYGASRPDVALDKIYTILCDSENNVQITNVSGDEQIVLIHLKHGKQINVSHPRKIDLYYNDHGLSLNICEEDWDSEGDWDSDDWN